MHMTLVHEAMGLLDYARVRVRHFPLASFLTCRNFTITAIRC